MAVQRTTVCMARVKSVAWCQARYVTSYIYCIPWRLLWDWFKWSRKRFKQHRILHRLILIKCERKIVYLAFSKGGLLLWSGVLIPLKLTPTITYIAKVNVWDHISHVSTRFFEQFGLLWLNKNLVYGLALHNIQSIRTQKCLREVSVTKWVERPRNVRGAMGSNPVEDSRFLPWHTDYYIFHSYSSSLNFTIFHEPSFTFSIKIL